MITIVAKNKVKLTSIEQFKKLASDLITESQKESGCIEYNLYEDLQNPTTLTFIEKWEDESSLQLHNQSNHFKNIVPLLSELTDEEMEITLYKNI